MVFLVENSLNTAFDFPYSFFSTTWEKLFAVAFISVTMDTKISEIKKKTNGSFSIGL